MKMGITNPEIKIDIVSVLLNPSKDSRKNQRIQEIKKAKRDQELKDETFMPKINKQANKNLIGDYYSTGSKHLDLYNQAAVKQEQKKLSQEELDFLKNKNECKFKPKIN